MSSIWPYISNQEAIRVNQLWVGDPGRLLNLTQSTAAGTAYISANATSNVQVWSKLQPGGAVALLAINLKAVDNVSLVIDLSDVAKQMSIPMDQETITSIPHGYEPLHSSWCNSRPCAIRDIW